MSNATKAEIEAGIRGIIKPAMGVAQYTFVWDGSKLHATISQMYEYVACRFEHLKAVSELCGTDHINLDKEHSDGCESCDYGSSYQLDLYIEGVKLKEQAE
jgi:hypothetical protein